MTRWEYGGAYKRHPVKGVVQFEDGSAVKTHDIFEPLPSFMKQADLLFIDPPWNKGNLNSFITKAERTDHKESFEQFYERLFSCISEIAPHTCYVEIGKQYLGEFLVEMKKLYKHVTFYNSTYYRKKENMCYVIRAGEKKVKLPLDNLDEEEIIKWVCLNEDYECIGDLCMGLGLVGVNAFKNGKRFVGTELNEKRLAVLVETLYSKGLKYELKKTCVGGCSNVLYNMYLEEEGV